MGSDRLHYGIMSEDDKRHLLEHAFVRRYKKGDTIIHKGDEADNFYLIMDGYIDIYVEDEVGRALLHRLGPGEFFGELALLTDGPRTASVSAVRDVTCALLRKAIFKRCLHERPSLAHSMIPHLVSMITSLTERAANLALHNVYGRLLIEFNRLAREVNNESVIEGRWTQADLADLIGTQRETVAKIMTELKRRGYVRRDMNRLTILKALPRRLCFTRLKTHY
jgi:CRP/FNR family transcriptional regulator, cyclic AMP receptor protein